MLLKPDSFICVELVYNAAVAPGTGYFGQVVSYDQTALLLRAIDIVGRRLTGWNLCVPWSNIKYVMISDATDLDGFANAVAANRAQQSAKVN